MEKVYLTAKTMDKWLKEVQKAYLDGKFTFDEVFLQDGLPEITFEDVGKSMYADNSKTGVEEYIGVVTPESYFMAWGLSLLAALYWEKYSIPLYAVAATITFMQVKLAETYKDEPDKMRPIIAIASVVSAALGLQDLVSETFEDTDTTHLGVLVRTVVSILMGKDQDKQLVLNLEGVTNESTGD